eukprot:GHVS01045533.1.p4 GENE.GHVS01045533.1~~GHVS01045533.1.p4  ORF type:complete len:107 (+),score=24.67 GHVS01045533.1:1425-1745(+)
MCTALVGRVPQAQLSQRTKSPPPPIVRAPRKTRGELQHKVIGYLEHNRSSTAVWTVADILKTVQPWQPQQDSLNELKRTVHQRHAALHRGEERDGGGGAAQTSAAS